ncbi:uncharacterized protein LOC119481763 isoform X3 [Sebastes umbrosus]|uniref:uncharacterized protein LOC119481763 isoform X3 n=1 Tax=Sebastes umbrosus TaxID=72105 RepID=UPI00189C9692|nr:uncharacterized protein LOC119481763 isoform X3 [Sebastes umbrosus]
MSNGGTAAATAQVSQVTLSVRRTSANQLLVRCESGGWSLEPVVSLLDSDRTVLAAQTGSTVRPDRLFSVSAVVNVAAAAATLTGSRTVTCRVEIPGTSLANEDTLHISDELDPSQEGLGRCLVLVGGAAFVLVCVVVSVVVFIVPVRTIEKLRSSVQRLRVMCVALVTRERDGRREGEEHEPLLGEYGDISRVETTRASEKTAMVNQLSCRGVEASNRLAERDLKKMLDYKDTIISQGQSLGVAPALIAAIISRQSHAGTLLKVDGFGQSDNNCFGLMQINKNYHAVKGTAFSKEHVDEGVTIFIQQVKTMRRDKKNWNKEQQLKGALACYIAGDDRVRHLAYEDLDSVTPNEDFANDVVARAQWFAHNGF